MSNDEVIITSKVNKNEQVTLPDDVFGLLNINPPILDFEEARAEAKKAMQDRWEQKLKDMK